MRYVESCAECCKFGGNRTICLFMMPYVFLKRAADGGHVLAMLKLGYELMQDEDHGYE